MNMRFVILCGGLGSRLWLESKQNLPNNSFQYLIENLFFILLLKDC